MSQNTSVVADGTGPAVITDSNSYLNNALNSIASGFSGPSAPGAGLFQGGTIPTGTRWFDTTNIVDKEWNGSAWVTLASINNLSITAQSTGGHVLGTVYHNTTTKPKFVNVFVNIAVGGLVSAYTDSSSSPGTVAVAESNYYGGGSEFKTLSFCVLPGNYYYVGVASGSASLSGWMEWS